MAFASITELNLTFSIILIGNILIQIVSRCLIIHVYTLRIDHQDVPSGQPTVQSISKSNLRAHLFLFQSNEAHVQVFPRPLGPNRNLTGLPARDMRHKLVYRVKYIHDDDL